MNPAVADATRCGSCGAPIFWALTEKAGERMPIDRMPHPEGTIRIDGGDPVDLDRSKLRAVTLGPLEIQIEDQPLYRSHFATCPDADAWRAKRRRPAKDHA